MPARMSFMELATRIAEEQHAPALLPVIQKELLHYEILAAMERHGFLDRLVFQGGTSLRLCYGSMRLSEDLDFAGGTDFDVGSMATLRHVVETSVTKRYDVQATVKEPKLVAIESGLSDASVQVERWQIQVVTVGGRPDIPHQRIKLEVALVPAHTKGFRPLIRNYADLPSSYENILLPVETPGELLADKLVSLATAKAVRYRDIWDLRWISLYPRADFSDVSDLVTRKVSDYRVTGFRARAESMCEKLPGIVESDAFLFNMQRFIEPETLNETVAKPVFRMHLADTVRELYRAHVLPA
ncbi:MAG: nucleotidyl transferase AbiEii/AbiGii toxin family protein [Coriobacteriales bacterium]|jgi:predicted nucleotidyltransferase component of viral defense system|nr:nucleotidyl transferase AbiEii/AbiGii toxin family protein [Coriobacteriales bacterium]